MLAVPAAKDLHILKHVLTVVALATVVLEGLAPNQSGVSSSGDFDANFLALMTLDHELGAFE